MRESEEFKDDFIRAVVAKGARKIPNADFEEQVMLKVNEVVNYKKEVSSKLALSFRSFLGALLLGVALMLSILLDKVRFSYDLKYVAVMSLFVITVIGVLNIDNYKRLLNKYSL